MSRKRTTAASPFIEWDDEDDPLDPGIVGMIVAGRPHYGGHTGLARLGAWSRAHAATVGGRRRHRLCPSTTLRTGFVGPVLACSRCRVIWELAVPAALRCPTCGLHLGLDR